MSWLTGALVMPGDTGGPRAGGSRLQLPNVLRVPVPGGFGWCLVAPGTLTIAGVASTIAGGVYALCDDGGVALAIGPSYYVVYVRTSAPTVLRACRQENWDATNSATDVVSLAYLTDHYDMPYPIVNLGCPFWTKSASDHTVRWIAGNGVIGWAGDGGDPRAAALALPWSVTKGPDQAYYIGTAGSVRKVTCHQISTVAGTGTGGHSGDGPATTTPIGIATGVAFDAAGLLWLTDVGGQYGGTDPLGAPFADPSNTLYLARVADPTGATFTALTTPNGSPYDTLRNVNLTLNQLASEHHTHATAGFQGSPWQVAIGAQLAIAADGTKYLASGLSWTERFTPFGPTNYQQEIFSFVATVAMGVTAVNLLASQIQYTPPPPFPLQTISQVGHETYFPQQMAVGPDGSLYWADGLTHAVYKRTPGGVFSTAFGVAHGPGSDLAHVNRPCGLAIDAAGNMFIADTGNHRVLRQDAITGIVTILCGVTGVSGNTPTGSTGTATRLNHPRALHVTPEGIVTICDFGNSRLIQMGGN